MISAIVLGIVVAGITVLWVMLGCIVFIKTNEPVPESNPKAYWMLLVWPYYMLRGL